MPINDQKEQITLKDYLLIIFSRKRFFLIPFMIIFFIASFGSFFLPKYYHSGVLVKIEEKRPINPLSPEGRMVMPQRAQEITIAERLKTLTEEILSYPQLIQLIKQENLTGRMQGDFASLEDLIKQLRKRVEIEMKSPEVFAVYYEDPDPQKAKEVVNSLIDIFIEENIREKKREAQAGVEYAERQAEIYKEKLAEAEGKLENFREKHSLQLPGKEVDMNVQMLVHFQSDAARIKMDINETKQKISKTQRQLSGEEPVIISQELMELNPVVARLNNELEELKVKLDTLLIEDPDSEEIIQVQQQIEEKRDQLEDEIKKTVTAETAVEDPLFYQRLKEKLNEAEEVLEDLQDREEELQQQVKVYEKRLSSLPEQEREYSRLRRDVEINNEIYKMLKMKAAESRLTAVELEQRGVNYELLEEGRLPLRPSRPQKLLIAIVALVLGMISGVGCVFIAEIADHSFKDTEDARSYLSLPFLGSVPKIMTKNEIRRRQRNQRNIVILFIVLIVSLIAAGIISTYQQQQKVSEILTTQEQQSQTR